MKLHLQLRHASLTAMKYWIKAIRLRTPDLEENIKQLLLECNCKLAKHPVAHLINSVNLSTTSKQEHPCLDHVFIEGMPILHIVDKCTSWSETFAMGTRQLDSECGAFTKARLHHHRLPRTVTGDNEFNRGAFREMCDIHDIKFIPKAANAHEANGIVERENRTLRSFFLRLK